MSLSVIINTLNEEKNIFNCLSSVQWADEIIIIDMYSDDKTIEIANSFTKNIFFHERTNYVEPAREYGIALAKNEWILILDADEMVPYSLRLAIQGIIHDNIYDGVLIPHSNYFFGKMLRGGGWGPLQDKHLRLFKRRSIIIPNSIHGSFHVNEGGKIYTISDPNISFIHFNYIDINHFIQKLNRYTSIEALEIYNGLKPTLKLKSVLLSSVLEFFKRYIIKSGYKDGFIGFYLALLMSVYKISVFAKYRLMLKYNSIEISSLINSDYEKIAGMVITEYLNSTLKDSHGSNIST